MMPLTPRLFPSPAFPVLLAAGAWLLAALGCFTPPEAAAPAPPLGGPEYSAIMATSDLAVGDNRVSFALVNRDNVPAPAAQVTVSSLYTPPGGDRVAKETVTAPFLPWPPEGSNRGVFVADLTFDVAGAATADNPGLWELQISGATDDGQPVAATTAVRVTSEPFTPPVGAPAPRSVTPTAGDVDDLATITSAHHPNPELYRHSVHQAVASGQPSVILFSTPAFCVSATCGPQLEILSRLQERYREQANFIHVEVFADPHLIAGDRLSAQRVPAVDEWGLPTEPWTFVVDRQGRISAKFEQFTPESEIEAALKQTL